MAAVGKEWMTLAKENENHVPETPSSHEHIQGQRKPSTNTKSPNLPHRHGNPTTTSAHAHHPRSALERPYSRTRTNTHSSTALEGTVESSGTTIRSPPFA